MLRALTSLALLLFLLHALLDEILGGVDAGGIAGNGDDAIARPGRVTSLLGDLHVGSGVLLNFHDTLQKAQVYPYRQI